MKSKIHEFQKNNIKIMSNKTYITFSLILLLTASYGQNSATAKADKLFESYQYVAAIEEYQKLAESKGANEYIYTQLAESYYNVFDSERNRSRARSCTRWT